MLELLQDIFNIYLCLQRFKECYKNEKRFIHKIINILDNNYIVKLRNKGNELKSIQ